MSIETASTTYDFSYGNFALRESVDIGERNLASYHYEDGTNWLETLDYGNDDNVQYTYDDHGRVTQQTYEDDSYVTYKYDNSGALAKVYDSQTGTTATYYYDFTDRMMKYVETSSTGTHSVGYTYDNINNLTKLVETIGTVTWETSYTYDDEEGWGDLLTAYNGVTITHDEIGNPLNDGTWTYTWQHGRQLASMAKIDQSEAWQFTYNADGMRTQRKNTVTNRTYNYTYLGSQLTHMTVDGHILYFAYDAAGTPMGLTYDGANYYYVTNIQGDVVSILDAFGTEVVCYIYDAWGNLVSTTGTQATTVGFYNPLRYRGYVYDSETELYYLQSRYYNPEMGRFINADGLTSTGQGVLGNNMFAYCGNNPVRNKDMSGARYCEATTVAGESAYARKISCQHQGMISREKQNPDPIGYYHGNYSSGRVYLVEDTSSIKVTFPSDVVIVDQRNKRNVQIRYSAWILDDETQMSILTILNQYERDNPTAWSRNEDIGDMMVEWDAHNELFHLSGHERCLHVDIDNKDKGLTRVDYWKRAITDTLKGFFAC